MSFSKCLKNARKRRGLTQAQLAKDSGLAIGTIQQYELNKRTPRPDALAKIASALKMGYSYTKEGEPFFFDFVDTVHSAEYEENEKFNSVQYTLAAHFDGDEYTEEELEAIKKFAEFVKSQRK